MSTAGNIDALEKRSIALTGNTDAAGNVTFNLLPAGFTAAPIVVLGVGPTGNSNLVDSRITALSASSCTVNVQQALAVTLLSISILASKIPANNVPVMILAREA